MTGALLVDTDAAATLLSISPRLLRQLEARGQVPSCRIGRLVRYSPTALEAWVAGESTSSAPLEPANTAAFRR